MHRGHDVVLSGPSEPCLVDGQQAVSGNAGGIACKDRNGHIRHRKRLRVPFSNLTVGWSQDAPQNASFVEQPRKRGALIRRRQHHDSLDNRAPRCVVRQQSSDDESAKAMRSKRKLLGGRNVIE